MPKPANGLSKPTISSIVPSTPPVTRKRQTTFTVVGSGFQRPLSAKCTRVHDAVVRNVTADSFRATVPIDGPPGEWRIQVINGDGKRSEEFTFMTVDPDAKANAIVNVKFGWDWKKNAPTWNVNPSCAFLPWGRTDTIEWVLDGPEGATFPEKNAIEFTHPPPTGCEPWTGDRPTAVANSNGLIYCVADYNQEAKQRTYAYSIYVLFNGKKHKKDPEAEDEGEGK